MFRKATWNNRRLRTVVMRTWTWLRFLERSQGTRCIEHPLGGSYDEARLHVPNQQAFQKRLIHSFRWLEDYVLFVEFYNLYRDNVQTGFVWSFFMFLTSVCWGWLFLCEHLAHGAGAIFARVSGWCCWWLMMVDACWVQRLEPALDESVTKQSMGFWIFDVVMVTVWHKRIRWFLWDMAIWHYETVSIYLGALQCSSSSNSINDRTMVQILTISLQTFRGQWFWAVATLEHSVGDKLDIPPEGFFNCMDGPPVKENWRYCDVQHL